MEIDAIIGIFILIIVLISMSLLIFWSRYSIKKIEEKKLNSARDIVIGLKNGK